MHWVKHRTSDDKYKLWSTVSDGWITEWLTRDEMIGHLLISDPFGSSLGILDKALLIKTFPNGWLDVDNPQQLITDKRYPDKNKLMQKILDLIFQS